MQSRSPYAAEGGRPASGNDAPPVPRTVLVGIGGYGRVHLGHLMDFHRRGRLVLVAVVAFPPEPDGGVLAGLRAIGCEVFSTFEHLLAAAGRLRLDFAVVPTPIHLHARMTIALLRAGLDVLVEKPLAATLAETAAVITAQRETGRMVAVGFQYLHAPEVLALKERLVAGAIGPLRRLVVHAAWPRSQTYYARNAWAGRLKVGEDWVLDSPVSNAMSHFLLVMLFLGGREGAGLAEPVRFRAELYRAQQIESFDTAVLRMETADGTRLDFYGTHSSREIGRPSLRIAGTTGTAEWVQDVRARLSTPEGGWERAAAPEADTRERMLQDVLARRLGATVPLCTPAMAMAHVNCIDKLLRHTPITPIPANAVSQYDADGQRYVYVPGMDQLLEGAARTGQGLAEAGASWGVPEGPVQAV